MEANLEKDSEGEGEREKKESQSERETYEFLLAMGSSIISSV